MTSVSLCPTFGGSNPGLHAELTHSVNDHLNLICGCAATTHPSAFASLAVSCTVALSGAGQYFLNLLYTSAWLDLWFLGPSFTFLARWMGPRYTGSLHLVLFMKIK